MVRCEIRNGSHENHRLRCVFRFVGTHFQQRRTRIRCDYLRTSILGKQEVGFARSQERDELRSECAGGGIDQITNPSLV